MKTKSIRLMLILTLVLSMALSGGASAMTIKTSRKMTAGTEKKCLATLNAYNRVSLDIVSSLKAAFTRDLMSIIHGTTIDLSKSQSFTTMKKNVTKQIKKLSKKKFTGVSRDMKEALELNETLGNRILEALEKTSKPLSLPESIKTAKSTLSTLQKTCAKVIKADNKALAPYSLKMTGTEEIVSAFSSFSSMLGNLAA